MSAVAGSSPALQLALRGLTEVRGVTNAAVVTSDGHIVDGVERGEGLGRIGELVTSALASSSALAAAMGDGEVVQTLIEYDAGPVLLAPIPAPAGTVQDAYAAVVGLIGVADLGRVRFQLRRMLPVVASALAEALQREAAGDPAPEGPA